MAPHYTHTAQNAPRFHEDNVADLEVWLSDLKAYFEEHNVRTAADQIQKAPFHATERHVRDLWKEVADKHANSTWEEFVEAILACYPEISGSRSGTLTELHKICNNYRDLHVTDLTRGPAFLRRFEACVGAINKGTNPLSNFDVCSKIAMVCTPELLRTLDMTLNGQAHQLVSPTQPAPPAGGAAAPVRRPNRTSIVEGGYKWEDVVACMRDLWRRGYRTDALGVGVLSADELGGRMAHTTESGSRLVKLEQDLHDLVERTSKAETETRATLRSLQSEVKSELSQGLEKSDKNLQLINETIQRLTNQQRALQNANAPGPAASMGPPAFPQQNGWGGRPNFPAQMNRPQNGFGGGQRSGFTRPPFTCNWCGLTGHMMSNCLDYQAAVRSGEVVPDSTGNLHTKSGEPIPKRMGPMDTPMKEKWAQIKASAHQYVVAPLMQLANLAADNTLWGCGGYDEEVIIDSGSTGNIPYAINEQGQAYYPQLTMPETWSNYTTNRPEGNADASGAGF
uniref:CCHC-type domain-containing protein n=1 Tax=Schizophyllum commune (strain H4-8 / FGSC 9210) TaxID=578458 RepID=D8QJM8_SCHCM